MVLSGVTWTSFFGKPEQTIHRHTWIWFTREEPLNFPAPSVDFFFLVPSLNLSVILPKSFKTHIDFRRAHREIKVSDLHLTPDSQMSGGSRVSDIHFELTGQWLDWRSLSRGDGSRLILTDNVKIRHCYLLGDMDSSRGVSSSIIDNSIVKLDQVPRWSDADYNVSDDGSGSGDPLSSSNDHDLTEVTTSRFPLDHGINSKLYLWRGTPWNLDVDAVVNSSNEVWTNLTFNVSH